MSGWVGVGVDVSPAKWSFNSSIFIFFIDWCVRVGLIRLVLHPFPFLCSSYTYLCIPPAGGAALDPEGGALRGLADAHEGLLVQVRPQGLAEPDGGGGLALFYFCFFGGCEWFGLVCNPLSSKIHTHRPSFSICIIFEIIYAYLRAGWG